MLVFLILNNLLYYNIICEVSKACSLGEIITTQDTDTSGFLQLLFCTKNWKLENKGKNTTTEILHWAVFDSNNNIKPK